MMEKELTWICCAGEMIQNHEYLMRDLWTMHKLRSTHRIGQVEPALKKLWEWYCLELMRRCARKNWEWGQERYRREKLFTECVWPGDEAFVMANLEAKLEHYCKIRDAKSNNSYEKRKKGRAKGEQREAKANPAALAIRYEEIRKQIFLYRQKAGQTVAVTPLDGKTLDMSVNNIRWTWDEHIRVIAKESSDRQRQKEARIRAADYNEMIFEEDGV